MTLFRAATTVACIASILAPGAAWSQEKKNAEDAATAPAAGDAAKKTEPKKSVAVTDCAGAMGALKVKMPEGLDAEKTCGLVETAITNAINGLTSDVPATRKVIYVSEDDKFYEALSKSLKKYGGKKDPVVVDLRDNKGPVITVRNIQAASPPNYRETGLGLWLDRIEDSGGKICQKPDDEVGFSGVLAAYALDFFAKAVVPWAVKKYKAATAYAPAKKLDAVLLVTSSGAQKGRITEIDFVKRGSVDCK